MLRLLIGSTVFISLATVNLVFAKAGGGGDHATSVTTTGSSTGKDGKVTSSTTTSTRSGSSGAVGAVPASGQTASGIVLGNGASGNGKGSVTPQRSSSANSTGNSGGGPPSSP